MENESQISLLITYSLAIFICTIKIAKLYEISKLISVSILIGNPPYGLVDLSWFQKKILKHK